jgi:hypothetical protein
MAVRRKFPLQLFHYTDQAGFIGIIQNKELWASKIQYLNDNREFFLAIDIASDILKERLSGSSNKREIEVINDIFTRISKLGKINICVCSFSEKSDLLSQWRGYSKEMGGYSIGFDRRLLEGISGDEFFLLRKCIYDPDEQKKAIKVVLDKLIAKHQSNEKRTKLVETSRGLLSVFTPFIREVNLELSLLFPLIKHQSFSEEAEWRLISHGNVSFDELYFRPGKSNLIPFTKMSLGELNNKILTGIIVGHTPNKDLAISSTQDILKKENIKIPVNASEIPFRNW